MEITQGLSRKLQTGTSVAHANEPPTLPQHIGWECEAYRSQPRGRVMAGITSYCFGKHDLGQVPLPVIKEGLVSSTTMKGDTL